VAFRNALGTNGETLCKTIEVHVHQNQDSLQAGHLIATTA
jgi:hypothetical protein